MNDVSLCYIQPLCDLRLPENTVDETSFSPYCLTNSKVVMSSLIDPITVYNMGQTFGTAAAIIYLNGDFHIEAALLKELSVDYFEKRAFLFLMALWIVKDHKIGLLPSILRKSLPNGPAEYMYFPYGQHYFNAAGGGAKPTEYTREDVRVAGEYYQDYIVNLKAQSHDSQAAPSQQAGFVPTEFDKTSTRLLRFVYLLDHARTIYDIGLKLALFCSCLECLFADESDKQDVTHKIAERTAFFLESTDLQRIECFDEIKKAYNLRSRVLHGGVITKDQQLQQLGQTCITIDSTLRKVFAKILASKSSYRDYFAMFTNNEEQLMKFLRYLPFSKVTSLQ